MKRIKLNYGGNTFTKFTGPVTVLSIRPVLEMLTKGLISTFKRHRPASSKVSREVIGRHRLTTMKKLTEKSNTGGSMELRSTHQL